ncbi:MAG TPA: hypothetical protein PLR98_13615, partial [Chitinophagaceae bacterium]|nr:hypothetical protein [Chitinophagaceae bacterium]
MKYLSLLTLLSISLNAFTQDCTKELLRQKPGKWKAGLPGSIVNVKATDLAKEKAVMASIHKMVAANYNPTGCEPLYSSV